MISWTDRRKDSVTASWLARQHRCSVQQTTTHGRRTCLGITWNQCLVLVTQYHAPASLNYSVWIDWSRSHATLYSLGACCVLNSTTGSQFPIYQQREREKKVYFWNMDNLKPTKSPPPICFLWNICSHNPKKADCICAHHDVSHDPTPPKYGIKNII